MVHPRCVRKYNKEYQRYQIGQTQHFTLHLQSKVLCLTYLISLIFFVIKNCYLQIILINIYQL